jgi:NADPH:quinone reductase-like Zn-dependent oxidoreductase
MNDFGVEAHVLFTLVTTERLAKLAELVDDGALKVHVHKTFILDQTGTALHHLEKESPRGKVVLKVV